jgi:hypothetical protein
LFHRGRGAVRRPIVNDDQSLRFQGLIGDRRERLNHGAGTIVDRYNDGNVGKTHENPSPVAAQ